jgi:hypothetical protein
MNRKFLVWNILLILFISIAIGTNVFAIPINVGDKIIISDGPGPYASITAGRGGAYNASSPDNLWEDFITFCLETDESLNFGGTFYVGGITTSADRGGINTDSGDDLSSFTAYLYTQAVNGIFNDEQLDDVQDAIWHEEKELEDLIGDKLDFYNEQYGYFIASSWTGLGSVRVINLTDSNGNYRQDLLVTAPVPEPTTMLLLGLGIVGFAGFGRKKYAKKIC